MKLVNFKKEHTRSWLPSPKVTTKTSNENQIMLDVLLQRHCAKYIYVIPDGLRELMNDITREVLRAQPEQIYSFIADYLDALMITRENARVAARFVESITEIGSTIANFLTRTGMTREEADEVATIIQNAFRKHFEEQKMKQPILELPDEATVIAEIIAEAGITADQAEEAALIIQTAFRHYRDRKQREDDLLKGVIDWRVAARSTMRLYRKTGVTMEEANRAATVIKAAYKGYYTRRLLRKLVEESQPTTQSLTIDENEEEYEDLNSGMDFSDDRPQEKSVRIDYGTVTPHVEFGDADLIAEVDAEATDISRTSTDVTVPSEGTTNGEE